MTAHLTLPAVTAALVRAGVQTVVSVDEAPTMACPEYGGAWRYGLNCFDCGGAGRVPLSGDVEIVAGGDIGEASDGWQDHDCAELGVWLTPDDSDDPDDAIPIVLDAPVARATVQCVPVCLDPDDYPDERACLEVNDGIVDFWPENEPLEPVDLSDQLPFIDLAAPWALILSDVRPVESWQAEPPNINQGDNP